MGKEAGREDPRFLDTPRWLTGDAALLVSGAAALAGTMLVTGAVTVLILTLVGRIGASVGTGVSAAACVLATASFFVFTRANRFATVPPGMADLPRERRFQVTLTPLGAGRFGFLRWIEIGTLGFHDDRLALSSRRNYPGLMAGAFVVYVIGDSRAVAYLLVDVLGLPRHTALALKAALMVGWLLLCVVPLFRVRRRTIPYTAVAGSVFRGKTLDLRTSDPALAPGIEIAVPPYSAARLRTACAGRVETTEGTAPVKPAPARSVA